MAQLNVNLANVDATKGEVGGFAIIPKGRWTMQIVEGEVKRNSKNTGQVFSYKAEVMDEGEFKGVKMFGSINVEHEKASTQLAGQAQLAALTHSCGLDPATTNDTDQFLYQPFTADIDVKPNTYQGVTRDQNNVVRFVYADNHHLPIPGAEGPANDNKAAPTGAANSNDPSTARSTQNGGSASTPPAGGRSMPWKK